jgi:hypothetical protein
MGIETIVIVHGTFSADAAWRKRGSAFCKALDASLEASGSSVRCWSHLAPDHNVKLAQGNPARFASPDFSAAGTGLRKRLAVRRNSL